jgi:hypothetical protein
MHIRCTNGTPLVDTLDHLPQLPLFVHYAHTRHGVSLTEQDEIGIHHALRLQDRVRHIDLDLPPSILHKVLVIIDKPFPILEHLSLSFALAAKNSIPLTLPKAFLAPNLRRLTLPGISPPRRLQCLTSTVSLVALVLSEIQTSSYFRPSLLVARLSSLPRLEELSIGLSIPIPRPSTERKLLGEQGAPVTLPRMKKLWFQGVGAYLESLVAQIRLPLLERLEVTLFNQIVFALPHLCQLVNTTEGFKGPNLKAVVFFAYDEVSVATSHHSSPKSYDHFLLRMMCKQLDWQIDCVAQICNALIPALSDIERLELQFLPRIPTELQNGAIDSTTWHELLRPFIGVKKLHIYERLLEELARALQVDGVGSDPGFLPNLRSIYSTDNLFTSFIDTRRVMGRPVQFVKWGLQWHGAKQVKRLQPESAAYLNSNQLVRHSMHSVGEMAGV